MASVTALVTPELMKWARETMGLRLDEAARKIGRSVEEIQGWEDGTRKPTMSQLRKVSEVYKRPLAVFFLPEPPRDFTTLRDFRRLPERETREYSVELKLRIRTVDFRRRWLSEYLESEGVEPLSFVGSISLRTPASTTAKNIRHTLEIDTSDIKQLRFSEALRYWVRKAEEAGVFVFRGREIPLEQGRGFVISDRFAPVIYINSRDAWSAQIFTLAHELAHIWLGHSGISNLEVDGQVADQDVEKIEIYCNQVAAEVVLAPSEFHEVWSRLYQENLEHRIEKISREFKVSEEVIARRLLQEGKIEKQSYESVRARVKERWQQESIQKKSGWAKHSVKMASRNGHLFTRTVINGFRSGNISGRDASELLNVKINHFPRLAQEVGLAA
jgi:Zn-dependent peptidase ImmA (M78 family)